MYEIETDSFLIFPNYNHPGHLPGGNKEREYMQDRMKEGWHFKTATIHLTQGKGLQMMTYYWEKPLP